MSTVKKVEAPPNEKWARADEIILADGVKVHRGDRVMIVWGYRDVFKGTVTAIAGGFMTVRSFTGQAQIGDPARTVFLANDEPEFPEVVEQIKRDRFWKGAGQ